MTYDSSHPHYELVNAVTHGLGLALGLVGVPILVRHSLLLGGQYEAICAGVFSLGLLMIYFSSTMYHATRDLHRKRLFHILDHACIFIMIGGTYTPVIYRYISTDMALPFLALIWGLVLIGCIFKVFYTGRLKVLSTILYLALGWMVILVAGPLSQALPPRQVFLLELGGGLYSAGVVFYIWKGLPYHHAIWHLFVVAGSTAHFFLIYNSAG